MPRHTAPYLHRRHGGCTSDAVAAERGRRYDADHDDRGASSTPGANPAPAMPPRPPHPAEAPDADDHLEAHPMDRAMTAGDAGGHTRTPAADGDPSETDRPHASLSDAAHQARVAIERLLHLASDPGTAGGELSALLGLLSTLDLGHAAAVELTDAALRRSSAQRSAGLPLEHLLAMSSRQTYRDRGALLRTTEGLRALPNVRAAWRAGHLGAGQVSAIVAEAARLDAAGRSALDERFLDAGRYAGWDPDRIVETVRDVAANLRPTEERDRELRRIEQRFHHIQGHLDGGVTGYYELDAEAGATWLEALQHASPAPTGAKDATRDAIDPDEATDAAASPGDSDTAPDGTPAFADRVPARTRARQRADGLVALAEAWLAGSRSDGSSRRARPRVHVWTDIETLTGHGDAGTAARLLWATLGSPAYLTADAARRLASDADLQFVVHEDGRVIGVSEPTATIPARVRNAVQARDQGCRFPGCRAPIHHTDLHHVVDRHLGGPTTTDNLVALCRRHHTAVTNRAWRLTMTPEGIVTVRRGRRTATSDPPHRRRLAATAPAHPT